MTIDFESQADELWSTLNDLCNAVDDVAIAIGDDLLISKLEAARKILNETEIVRGRDRWS